MLSSEPPPSVPKSSHAEWGPVSQSTGIPRDRVETRQTGFMGQPWDRQGMHTVLRKWQGSLLGRSGLQEGREDPQILEDPHRSCFKVSLQLQPLPLDPGWVTEPVSPERRAQSGGMGALPGARILTGLSGAWLPGSAGNSTPGF